jgi:hypothetical protein
MHDALRIFKRNSWMSKQSRPKECPRCNALVQGDETLCMNCGFDLTSRPSEEVVAEMRLVFSKKWWFRAKKYGKWGTIGFIAGMILVLVPIFLGKMLEMLPYLAVGIILLFVSGAFYALSVYVENKIEKGEDPFS